MILVDPDLDPDPQLRIHGEAGLHPADPIDPTASCRLPSARTLTVSLTKHKPPCACVAQVTVLLTTDAAIRRLNRRFRGKNKATDVLSFPAIFFSWST